MHYVKPATVTLRLLQLQLPQSAACSLQLGLQ